MSTIELSADQTSELNEGMDSLRQKLVDPHSLDEDFVSQNIKAAYAVIGLAEPRVIWCDGPATLLAEATNFRLGKSFIDPQHLIDDSLSRESKTEVRETFQNTFFPGWWRAWLFIYEKMLKFSKVEKLSKEKMEQLKIISAVNDSFMWCPMEAAVFMLRQHTEMHIDRNELHKSDGPAWSWADGFMLHALGGTRVPAWAINTDDPSRFLKEISNATQRRACFDNFGWDRAADVLGWKPLDRDPDPTRGTLYEYPGEDFNILIVRNASPELDGRFETYGLTVANHVRTVVEAQSSMLGLTEEQYEQIKVHT